MRICLVSKEYPPAGAGGIANYVYDLAHGLAAAGQDVTVIAGAARAKTIEGKEKRENGSQMGRLRLLLLRGAYLFGLLATTKTP